MAFKTQFAGYTPEDDLSSNDWTLRLSADALATVRGVLATKIANETKDNNAVSYTFNKVISNAGLYQIGVYGANVGVGIASVQVDGINATEINTKTDGGVSLGMYVIDIQSLSNGNIQIDFNSGPQAVCGIVVWQIKGPDSATPEDNDSGDLGATKLIDVATRASVVAIGGTDTKDTNHFWSALNKLFQTTIQDKAIYSAASLNKKFSGSSEEIGLFTGDDTIDGGWVGVSWVTPVAFFPSGQGALFQKTVSDANTIWAWNAIPINADVDVLALVRPTLDSNDANIGVVARMTGAAGAEDSYSFLLTQSAPGARDQIKIAKTNGSSTLTTIGALVSFSWALNTSYWMRFRVRGTTLQARIWADGATEPITWNIERTDSDITAAGYVGLWQEFTGTQFLVGHFEAMPLFAEWPVATVPQNWDITTQYTSQSNKVDFTPSVGAVIDRRRASSVVKDYAVNVPGLTQTQLDAFFDFYHTTLKEGTLRFTADDPYSGVEKTFKFTGRDNAYSVNAMRAPGSNLDNGLFQVSFTLQRLD